jgi:2-methylcitrate dehydratase PrpD
MIYKAFPCCGANHYAIDGVLHLMAAEGLEPVDVDEITVAIHGPYLDDVLVYPWPRTGLEGKFSLAYNVAAALVDGAVTMSTFDDAHLLTLDAARAKVRVEAAADLGRHEARIGVRTVDGRTIERHHTTLRGSLESPFTWAELAGKFLDNCAGALSRAAAEDAVSRLETLEDQPSLRPLTEQLRG